MIIHSIHSSFIHFIDCIDEIIMEIEVCCRAETNSTKQNKSIRCKPIRNNHEFSEKELVLIKRQVIS